MLSQYSHTDIVQHTNANNTLSLFDQNIIYTTIQIFMLVAPRTYMIHSAKFLTSANHYTQCPVSTCAEFAIIGRSNVGKSSLINSLCRSKELAKTSSKPGKTQLINYFEIVSSQTQHTRQYRYLVDLP